MTIKRQRYWNLVRELAIADFKLRYQGSVLGYLWSLVKPLLLFGVLYLVFSVFMRFDIAQYNLYLLLGVILWGYLAEGTTTAISNLVNKGGLIARVSFPRTIIVVASTVTSLITLFLNLIVFMIFFIASGVPVHATVVLFPLLLLELYLITTGLGLLISALNIKVRDLSHIWEVMLQIGFWATPIIYSMSMIPAKYHFWYFMNPMTRIIKYSRDVVIYGIAPDLKGVIASFFMAIALFVVGYLVFKKREPYFAEDL
ncbi:MAG: ABC transporter permease [Patescibacteria group bacterium]|nr:ABC transporter permease [Patescibacteria group bacterium]MDD5715429.1 ABC transporter permease [Patescibacteria group bacterium]